MRVRRRVLPSRVGCGTTISRRRQVLAFTSADPGTDISEVVSRLPFFIRLEPPAGLLETLSGDRHTPDYHTEVSIGPILRGR